MASLAGLLLLLVFPLGSSQTAVPSTDHRDPPPPQIRELLRKEEGGRLNAKQTYVHVDKDNTKVGVFIAAAMGTFALMAAVYCIYNNFYIKQQYLHTQLSDHPDLSAEGADPPTVFFRSSVSPGATGVLRASYGSLSDSPSIISVPPSLSPPPSAMPFPPLFLSSHSLRTISAKDLEKSYI